MKPHQISSALMQAIEENSDTFTEIGDEIKLQMKSIMDSQIEKMGLVTREEFEVLRLSMDKALQRISSMEEQLSTDKPDDR